jgi:hypothetical protein
MTWLLIVAVVCYTTGWFGGGYLIGRRSAIRRVDRLLDTTAMLIRSSEDTPLRRAQTVDMPDRSGWEKQ